MIDLMNNGHNGHKIPCPSCEEYDHIKEALSGAAIYDDQPALDVLHILVTELKMWRAKDEFDRRTKLAITQMIELKLKNGFQMDS